MNGLFGVNGLLGYVVAVVLLLAIVFILGMNAVGIQAGNAQNYYKLDKPETIKMISENNANVVVDAKK